MRFRRRGFVHVEGLRIVGRGECLDILGGERVAAEFDAVADLDVVEIPHVDAPGLRRSSICGQTRLITFSPLPLDTSHKKLTKPRSGLLCESRAHCTLPRTVS